MAPVGVSFLLPPCSIRVQSQVTKYCLQMALPTWLSHCPKSLFSALKFGEFIENLEYLCIRRIKMMQLLWKMA